MIKLGMPKEPYWIDLAHGVRVRVRPLTTAMYEAARAKALRRVREIVDERRAIEEAGGRVEGLPDLADPDQAAGFSQFVFAQGLAQAAVFEWEGVLAADGSAPAAVADDTVAELMMVHRLAEEFVVRYTATHERLILEGKGSGPSPSGTSATGPRTAGRAASKARHAPKAGPARTAAAAPTRSTRRRP